MAARRVTKSAINWAALAERVPENQKAQYQAFKAKSDGYLRRVLENPENPPKIDWSFYKSRIPVPGMVDNFQKQYEAFKIPYPADNVTAQIAEQEKEANVQIKAFILESQQRIAEYNEKLSKLKAMLPYDQMTMEDFYKAHPELTVDVNNPGTFWPHTEDDKVELVKERAASATSDH